MRRSLFYSLIISLITFTLISCGGGGSAGIGGTGISITSSGTITAFGSIFVNGVEFETNSSTVNGDLSQVSELELGMVVTVRGQVNADGVTGTADTINVDIELEGPVANTPVLDTNNSTKTFEVLGRTIVASDGITVFDDTGFPVFAFDSIAQNDVVEVSGYLDFNGNLQATRIEKKGVLDPNGTSVEVNGVVGNILAADSFELIVNGTPLTINDPNAVAAQANIIISTGLELEIEGTLTNNTDISATEIELDDNLFDNNDSDIEIEGFITNYINDSNFMINGQQIDASNATFTPASLTLANNIKVEVEGTLINGVLQADEVEGRAGEIRIDANVSSGGVDTANNKITLAFFSQTVTVTVNNQTRYEDDISSNPLTLLDINDGDFLEIRAYQNNGDIIVTDLKRETDDPNGDVRLRGSVTAIDNTTPGQESVTILGITHSSDAGTDFEINDTTQSRGQFFNALAVGNTVEIKDDKISGVIDGVADEMDLKN
jgi:hypothetical protein